MEPLLLKTWVRRHCFRRAEGLFEVWFCLSQASLPDLVAKKSEFLSEAELQYFQPLRAEARQRSFLLGRCCVKEALAACTGLSDREAWEVYPGVFQQPVLRGPGTQNLQTSLSDSGTAGVAVLHPEAHPMAVDIERINGDRREAVQSQMTAAEQALVIGLAGRPEENLMLVWSAKEALSKVLRTGLMTPFTLYELENLVWDSGCLLGTFRNFAQYRLIAFALRDLAFALVLPKKSELDCPLAEFKRGLAEAV